jgi:ATP-dependent RNA helicase RhlB
MVRLSFQGTLINMKFSELNLHKDLMLGIEDARFTDCLPVQERTYEHTLKGRDVMVQSQTGSGKTAAFLVSIYQLFTEGSYKNQKRALIIAPTRELAVQIEDEAKILGVHLPFRTGCFYGGVGYEQQQNLLHKGVDIVIGTPGRLIDLNQSRKLNFGDIGILVIDEADRLFDMGFLPDIRRMVKKMPDASQRQTMLFSATLTGRVRELAMEYMNDPVEIEVAPEQVTVNTVSQCIYHVARDEKMSLLLGVLKKENPSSALIFTNMKTTAIRVARQLEHNGLGCEYIIGDLPQKQRLKIINAIKTGTIRILVATDVAARGLHINDLDLVVNYDLPADPEAYVHRIGRTARAGKRGKAITLVCESYVYGLEAIESLINMKIPVEWAEESEYVKDISAGMRLHDERREKRPAMKDNRTGKTRHAGKPRQIQRSRHDDKLKHEGMPEHAAKAGHSEGRKHVNKTINRSQTASTSHDKTINRKSKKSEHTSDHRQPARHAAPPQESRHRDEKKQKRQGIDRKQSLEDRITYYRKKYGEDFNIPAAPSEPKKRKRTKFLESIKGIFSRK